MMMSPTCEVTAQQFHAQGAVSPAELGVNADVLGFDWWREGVGHGRPAVCVAMEKLKE